MTTLELLANSFRVSSPHILVNTPDQKATRAAIHAVYATARPMIAWDVAGAAYPINRKGETEYVRLKMEPVNTESPTETLKKFADCSPDSLLILEGVDEMFERDPWVASQAFANLTPILPPKGAATISLATACVLPPRIAREFIVFDEPFPNRATLLAIVKQQFKNAKAENPSLVVPDAPTLDQCAQILLGTSNFEAEQLSAHALERTGINQSLLFASKRALVAKTPGTTLADPSVTLGRVGGHEILIARGQRIVNGRADIGAIIFFDEIEKSMAGASGDTSGVSGDQHGALLSWFADVRALGLMFEGLPGTGKTWLALYLATLKKTGFLPFLKADMGAMKSSLVGSSEARFRNFLKTATALTEGGILVVATTNDVNAISPELRSRFTLGTYHFDATTRVERSKIWPIYLGQYQLGTYDDLSEEMRDQPWTGREIASCCQTAWNERISLEEAAKNVVPVTVTDAERLNRLRESAHNTFLSTTYEGVYRKDFDPDANTTTRKISTWGV